MAEDGGRRMAAGAGVGMPEKDMSEERQVKRTRGCAYRMC